jgi:hypothetical protein
MGSFLATPVRLPRSCSATQLTLTLCPKPNPGKSGSLLMAPEETKGLRANAAIATDAPQNSGPVSQ